MLSIVDCQPYRFSLRVGPVHFMFFMGGNINEVSRPKPNGCPVRERQFGLAFQHHDPFVFFLIIPTGHWGFLAFRDDPLYSHALAGGKLLEDLLFPVPRYSLENIIHGEGENLARDPKRCGRNSCGHKSGRCAFGTVIC